VAPDASTFGRLAVVPPHCARRCRCAGALAFACCTAVAGAEAENWRFTPSVGILETYTSNVNDAPSGQEVGDWVTSLTAAVGVAGEGRRVKLNGSIAVTADLYARENQNNTIYPTSASSAASRRSKSFFSSKRPQTSLKPSRIPSARSPATTSTRRPTATPTRRIH
jgi:hypothetical protein